MKITYGCKTALFFVPFLLLHLGSADPTARRCPEADEDPDVKKEPLPSRVLFVTLEYADPIFSGNGVLSRTMVRSLADQGYKVAVICARPNHSSTAAGGNGKDGAAVQVFPVIVPTVKWQRLDRLSAWQDFAMGMSAVENAIKEFGPSVVMAVDWSGWYALEQLAGVWRNLPSLFLSFRVFSQSAELLKTADDRHFYAAKECAALHRSWRTVALSHYDAGRLRALSNGCLHGSYQCSSADSHDCPSSPEFSSSLYTDSYADVGRASGDSPSGTEGGLPGAAVSVLWPPVRSDILVLGREHRRRMLCQQNPLAAGGVMAWARRRRFVTCCVRLSREKNAMLFADLAVELSAFFRSSGIALLLCGAAADKSYADAVKDRLRSAGVQVEVWEKFSSAEKLMAAFESSLLNIHPSLHDAFGMTVMEAASVATPSLVHDSRAVGVGEVFSPMQIFRTDFSAPVAKVATTVRNLLEHRLQLFRAGRSAQHHALSFDLDSYKLKLDKVVRDVVRV